MAGSIQEAAGAVVRQVRSRRERMRGRVAEMTETQQRLLAVFRFLATFVVLAAPLYVLLHSGWDGSPLRAWTASAATALLNLAGLDAASSGSVINSAGIVVDVTRDSTGWKSLMAFTALVFATRDRWRRTVLGIVGGTIVILAVNVLRVASMVYAVEVFHVDYELLHTVLWRWGLTGIVLGTWLAWRYTGRYGAVDVRMRISRLTSV